MKQSWINLVCVPLYVQLAGAVCQCSNGQQSFIPSHFSIDPPSPFNGTDATPSSFGSTCVEQDSLYQCNDNTDNPLFDCNVNHNSYYGWNTQQSFSMVTNFTSHFQSMDVLVTFLISTSNNVSIPTSLQYFVYNLNAPGLPLQDYLPTNLPEGSYQYKFTLSVDVMFSDVVIIIIPNNTFQWVAIDRIIFCAAANEALPVSSTNGDDDLVSIVIISILAVSGTLLLIIIILETVVLLVHKRRKMSVNSHTDNAAGQSKHHHGNKDVLPQGAKVDPASSRVETDNELYIISKTDSLDHSGSVHSVNGCDVTITANPSYVIDPNPPQTDKKCEQRCDYDYVQSDQHNIFQLIRTTTSDEVYDDTVIDPVSDDDEDVYI